MTTDVLALRNVDYSERRRPTSMSFGISTGWRTGKFPTALMSSIEPEEPGNI